MINMWGSLFKDLKRLIQPWNLVKSSQPKNIHGIKMWWWNSLTWKIFITFWILWQISDSIYALHSPRSTKIHYYYSLQYYNLVSKIRLDKVRFSILDPRGEMIYSWLMQEQNLSQVFKLRIKRIKKQVYRLIHSEKGLVVVEKEFPFVVYVS